MKTPEEVTTRPDEHTEVPLTKEEKQANKKEQKRLKKKEKKEGRRIRSLEPMSELTPFLMKKRNDACNFFEAEFDTEAADAYITQKRKEGLKSFSMMHLLIAAYVRTVAEYPGVNRFIRGQRVMARNRIVIIMTIKREAVLDKGETVVKFYPKANATAEEIYRSMEETIEAAHEENSTDFDKTIKKLTCLPRFMLRGTVHLLHLLDYYGIMPKSLVNVSPFHGSLCVTSMGSLGMPPIYHHIYNFGNIPLFLAFGSVEKKLHLTPDGDVVKKRFLPLKVTCDERICDGHYYATFLKTIRRHFKNPHLLDTPPAEVKEDIP